MFNDIVGNDRYAFQIESIYSSNAFLIYNKDDIAKEIRIATENKNNNFTIDLKDNSVEFGSKDQNIFTFQDQNLFTSNISTHTLQSDPGKPISIISNDQLILDTETLVKRNLYFENDDLIPSNIALLDSNLKLPAHYFPENITLGDKKDHKISFSNGTSFGIGTQVPKQKLHVYNGSALIENGSITIEYASTSDQTDSALHIKNPIGNIPAVKLSNNKQEPSIELYAENPRIIVGCNINGYDSIRSDVQLYIEKDITCSNIECKDVILDNISLKGFYQDVTTYQLNRTLNVDSIVFDEGSNIVRTDNTNNTLLFNDIQIPTINTTELTNYRTIDNIKFETTKTSITKICCSDTNTFIVHKETLYRLTENNTYQFIEKDIIDNYVKVENNILIYKSSKGLHFLKDINELPITIHDGLKGGYVEDHILWYSVDQKIKLANLNSINNTTLLKEGVNIEEIISGKTVSTSFAIISNSDRDTYLLQPWTKILTNDIVSISINDQHVIIQNSLKQLKKYVSNSLPVNITFDNDLLSQPEYFEARGDNLLIIKNNIAYIVDSNFNTIYTFDHDKIDIGSISKRHVILYDSRKHCIITRSLGEPNDNYSGLGRNDKTIKGSNLNTDQIRLSAPYDQQVSMLPSVMIGGISGFDHVEIPSNSLCVERSVGIGCIPDVNGNYSLKVRGNIYLEDGDIIVNKQMNSNVDTELLDIDLDNYVTKRYLSDQVDYITNLLDTDHINNRLVDLDSNINTLYDLTSNMDESVFNSSCNIWKKNSDYDSIFVLDKQVVINKEGIDNNILGGSTVPALYVGTTGRFRGIVCEDDIAAFSDRKIKKDIRPLHNSLDKILNLNGVDFLRRDVSNSKRYIGLIAQEVEKHIPELVGEVNGIKTVAYSNIVAVLVEAIKELHQQIETLKNER